MESAGAPSIRSSLKGVAVVVSGIAAPIDTKHAININRFRGFTLPPIKFPRSPEWWRGDEALQAEAQAPQAPREQGDQAAGNVSALRTRSLFSTGVRFATASHMPVDTAQ